MASTSMQSQPNGISSSAGGGPSQPPSQPTQNTASSGTTTIPNTQTTTTGGPAAAAATAAAAAAPPPPSPTTQQAPRPRDARTIELLLTSQGVTSWDSRVPLLLLDFAYRHTSSILSDALHLAPDPYTSHAGSRPSAASGAVPQAPSGADAVVTTSALGLAVASRQAYQFRGGGGAGGAGGGGASKDWLQELARERNRVALPRVLANEWGVRLPNERFVLSGLGWNLREHWSAAAAAAEGAMLDDDDSDADEDLPDADADGAQQQQQQQKKDGGAGETQEEGGLDELLGDDMADEDMEDMEAPSPFRIKPS
ncbi:TFIID-31kDa-domain-containing protein [Xylariaceae sp. FL0804]|nr:TFIID-31kDa-domain-containing protein [Xylariaceae sp. FL0804]